MACVRPITRVRVAGRTIERSQAFVESVGQSYSGSINAVSTVEEAVRGAHIVVTATTAHTPVLRAEWLAPGAHVNAVGASQRTHQEIDAATVAAASLFVDRRQSVESEAADFRQALNEGLIGASHVRAELGELLVGAASGRESPEEITLFRSLGLAVEDVAAAIYVVQAAEGANAGSRAPW